MRDGWQNFWNLLDWQNWLTFGGANAPGGGNETGGGGGGGGGGNSTSPTPEAEFQYEHYYRNTSYTTCSPQDAMSAAMAAGMSAPGAPRAQDGVAVHELSPLLPLMDKNPIIQEVSRNSGEIINTTRAGHIFHSGTVRTTFTPYGGGSMIETIGTGRNRSWLNARTNEILGWAWFSRRNYTIAAGCMLDAPGTALFVP